MDKPLVRHTIGAAALMLSLLFAAPMAAAATVVATTADAGSTVSLATGDRLVVKFPGRWTLAADLTPELVFDKRTAEGSGRHAMTTFTFSADSPGSATFEARNAITHAKLSILVDVMAPQQ